VKLSAKSDYAARAVLGLASRRADGKAVRAEELAQERGIPAKYLVQILNELKSQNIVRSLRGKDGGYLLAKDPAEITLGEIVRTIQGTIGDAPSMTDTPGCPAALVDAWKALQIEFATAADQVNFQQLLDAAGSEDEMYYI
jgi:Rrf2 family protein